MKNNIYKISLILTIVLFSIINLQAKDPYKKTISELEQYYSQALKDWKVPGMAIAIVKDNEVVFAKGFGVKSVDTKEAVDKNSLFAIASNTKAFTSASIAMLIEEGKLSWDDKVTKHLPWFELYNPYVTHEMTIRDLLSHRSGLRTFSGDLLWYGTNYSREEIVRRAKYLEPAYGFRARYGYQNIMFMAAGLIIEEASGMSWEDFVQKRIFDPIKMNRTITSITDLKSKGNYTTPHNDYKGELITIEYLNWDNAAPLGGILSSVSDLSNWILLQLNHGIVGTDTLFTNRSQHEMWQAHTIQTVSTYSEKMFPSTHFKAYGLGWGLMDYHGRKIVSHGGGYDGMISRTVLVPEENLGFVILTNTNTGITSPLMYKTLDMFLSDDGNDWSKIYLERNNRPNDTDPEEKRIKNTKPSFDLKAYTGIYGGKVYGKTEVYLEDGKLMLQMKNTEIFKGTLTHWHFDTFELEFKGVTSLPKGKVQFKINAEGEIKELVIDVPNPDFDFTELDFIKIK